MAAVSRFMSICWLPFNSQFYGTSMPISIDSDRTNWIKSILTLGSHKIKFILCLRICIIIYVFGFLHLCRLKKKRQPRIPNPNPRQIGIFSFISGEMWNLWPLIPDIICNIALYLFHCHFNRAEWCYSIWHDIYGSFHYDITAPTKQRL